MQGDPKVHTWFVCFVEVHYAYHFPRKNSRKKDHEFSDSLLGKEPINIARHCKRIEIREYWLAILCSGGTGLESSYLQFQLLR
jgi:hypothetical protein